LVTNGDHMVIISITPEIHLDDLKTYSGGLGVLESDKFYAAGDMGLEYIVLSLMYRRGYVDLEFRGEEPIPKPQTHDSGALANLSPGEVFSVRIRGEDVIVQPWIYRYKTAKAVLFEAICPMWARELTDRVYVDNSLEQKFLRYSFFAKAASHYIKKYIGLDNVSIIDLQEAHTTLMLLNDIPIDKFRYVIHTPGPWGHPSFPGDYVAREFGVFISDYISLTQYALERLGKANVVSMKQRDVLNKVFPKYSDRFNAVTNGIYLERWMHPDLYRAYRNNKASIDLLKKTRMESKKILEKLLKNYKDMEIGDRMVITWTRRLARYKRPYFVARFIEENHDQNVIYVLGGKPHPQDQDGLEYARIFRKLHLQLNNVIYVHDYDVEKARVIIQGSDLMLFTPFSGWEACGTSYMKAMVNGVPVLSSKDGGVLEVVRENINSWLFGDDIRDLINIYTDGKAREIDEKDYGEFSNKLRDIIKTYYEKPDRYWEVAYNALIETPDKVDIKKVLRKYYLETR